MTKQRDRQNRIINFIEGRGQVSISEILELFNNEFNRSTIQRDLNLLQNKGLIMQLGAGRATSYSMSKISELFIPVDAAQYFDVPYFNRDINKNFNFEIFNLLKSDIFNSQEIEELEGWHKKFISSLSKYDSQTIINKELERIIIEFSWKSSAIEGNTYSLLSTEILIKNNIAEKGKTKEETQMILNHKDAFNEIIQNKDKFLQINFPDIQHIHNTITKNLQIPKNVRRNPVRVTGTEYRPLDNEAQIRKAIDKMIALINAKESFFEKSFLALVLIPYMQIFEDGNKRSSRMIANAILLANNSVPLSYRMLDIEDYQKAMILFYELNNIYYMKQIFMNQFKDAANNYFQ